MVRRNMRKTRPGIRRTRRNLSVADEGWERSLNAIYQPTHKRIRPVLRFVAAVFPASANQDAHSRYRHPVDFHVRSVADTAPLSGRPEMDCKKGELRIRSGSSPPS